MIKFVIEVIKVCFIIGNVVLIKIIISVIYGISGFMIEWMVRWIWLMKIVLLLLIVKGIKKYSMFIKL